MAHIHDKIDYAVVVYIVANDKVLLVRHKELEMWLPIGGHIELDEDPEKALFREIEEESGLKKTDIKLLSEHPQFQVADRRFLPTPEYVDIHPINKNHEHIGLVYFATTIRENVALNPEEHHKIQWVGKEELNDPHTEITEGVKFYSKKALERIQKYQ